MWSQAIAGDHLIMPANAAPVPQAARHTFPRISADWTATLIALGLAALAWSGLLPRVGW